MDNLFYGIFMTIGVILSVPVILLERITKKDLIKEDDPFDRWSLGHVLASVLWFFIFYISVGVSNIQAFYLSFGVMYLYEILFDMTKIEDKEGFSMQDIGADFVGSILALLITIIKL